MVNIYFINKNKNTIRKNNKNILKKIDAPKYILNRNEKSLIKFIIFVLFIVIFFFSFTTTKKISKKITTYIGKSKIFDGIGNTYKLYRVILPY